MLGFLKKNIRRTRCRARNGKGKLKCDWTEGEYGLTLMAVTNSTRLRMNGHPSSEFSFQLLPLAHIEEFYVMEGSLLSDRH